jgi:hypothetical protein
MLMLLVMIMALIFWMFFMVFLFIIAIDRYFIWRNRRKVNNLIKWNDQGTFELGNKSLKRIIKKHCWKGA